MDKSIQTVQIDINRDLPLPCSFIDGLLAKSMRTGRCTSILRNMMVAYAAGIPQRAGGRDHLFEPQAICQVIRILESITSKDFTKGPSVYEKGPLAGLYKKHFFQASFLIENLLLELRRDGPNALFRKLSKHYGPQGFMDKKIDEIDLQLFAQATVKDALERRPNRRTNSKNGGLTGEHLIFAKSTQGNIYLYASYHGESVKQIVECIRCSAQDFPELRGIVPALWCDRSV